jgi:hypothetical protein
MKLVAILSGRDDTRGHESEREGAYKRAQREQQLWNNGYCPMACWLQMGVHHKVVVHVPRWLMRLVLRVPTQSNV